MVGPRFTSLQAYVARLPIAERFPLGDIATLDDPATALFAV